ncbi:amidohydrolase family protein [Pullulanibacillus sp. KACC 23026]|uniref:amidohydrolase family protein n=1 Tax=Pullulanibacillus sp. KACC 23026 TaxID=3028315 RepID=UPI0023AFDA94|nr:amidohydrolase family protein [Pullulanibacillus sp. KACC 23026]WEG11084.1 amidohydrolase family protein [Pullulanibacillus sp. KACC 23026]
MRIDAHQHYWKINRADYGWITPDIPVLYRDFMVNDLKKHLEENNIDKTIVVQAAPTIEETEFILDLSTHSTSIAGVVGWVDLEDPTYKEQLNKFREHPKFIGIRIMIQDMPDESRILEPHYLEAFAYLEELDLPIDLLVKASQLPVLLKLLNQVSIRGVIDHIAKPNIAKGELEPWKRQISEIAKHPNIYCKLSGMVTEANHNNWRIEEFIPYVHHIIEEFGTNRVMYGSDWPVCLLSASYNQVYQLLKDTLPRNITSVEIERIFGANAIEFYQLDKL